jgi:hypothetical protein
MSLKYGVIAKSRKWQGQRRLTGYVDSSWSTGEGECQKEVIGYTRREVESTNRVTLHR